MGKLKRVLGALGDVRRDEWRLIVPLASAYILVMASLYVLKPVRNALFLDGIGIAQLPYVLLLVALIGGGAAALFSRFTARIGIDRLVPAVFAVLTLCLVLFRLLLPQGLAWSYYLFYVWVNIYGLMATSLLWLLAGTLFDARQARRLFGVIGAAGIVGAILGGGVTTGLVEAIGTENLLLLCAGMLVLCLGVLSLVRPVPEPAVQKRGQASRGALEDITSSDLLRLMAGMAALVGIVTSIADVQFNEIVDRIYPSKDAKTAFFGQFFAGLSALAFVVQLGFTQRVVRSWGATSALLFLPLSLAFGSLAVLVYPSLIAAIALKLGDGSFRHSIHKSATEILFLPLPADIKQRTKVLLDTTVDNLANGIGALLVLAATGMGLAYRHLSWVSLGLILLWVFLIARSRQAYVGAFRRALERREIDVDQASLDFSEAAAFDALLAHLDSGNERRVLYVLDALAGARNRRLVEPMGALLDHPLREVRCKALRILQVQDGKGLLEEVAALLDDDALDVRIEAMHYLGLHGGHRFEQVQQELHSADLRRRTAAAGCIIEYGDEAEKGLLDEEFLQNLLGEAAEEGRILAAKALVVLDQVQLGPYLKVLMEDPSPAVVQQVIESVGLLEGDQHIEWLIEQLGNRHYRPAARRALANRGVAVIEPLGRHLSDGSLDPISRNHLVRVLGDIPHQKTVDFLLDRIEAAPVERQFPLIKILNKINNRGLSLDFSAERIGAILQTTLKYHYDLLQVRTLLCIDEEGGDGQLLDRALGERLEQNIERIFRLLGLRPPSAELANPPRDMYYTYLGYVSGASSRASALEFLENVLDREQKSALLPFLEQEAGEALFAHGQALFQSRLADWQAAWDFLVEGSDPWLRACAVYSATDRLLGQLPRLQQDPNEVVRETADLMRQRLSH